MARPGIDKAQVFAAATSLTEQGGRATVQAVRDQIGSGSFSTISNHLAEWKAQNDAATAAAVPVVPEGVQMAFARVWALASQAARVDMEQQREAFEAMRRDMVAEKAELTSEVMRLEQAAEDLARAADLAARDRDALKIEVTRLEERCAAEHRRGDELMDQLRTLQADLAHAAKATQKPVKPAAKRKTRAQP